MRNLINPVFWSLFITAFTACGNMDNTPPVITLSTPVNNGVYGTSLTLSGTAADDTGVAAVFITVNGVSRPANGTDAWYTVLDYPEFENGCNVMITAYDTVSNMASISISITINMTNTANVTNIVFTTNASYITNVNVTNVVIITNTIITNSLYPAVQNFTASKGAADNTVYLSWDAVPGVEEYRIYASAYSNSNFVFLGATLDTAYKTRLDNNLTNYYKVKYDNSLMAMDWGFGYIIPEPSFDTNNNIFLNNTPSNIIYISSDHMSESFIYRLYRSVTPAISFTKIAEFAFDTNQFNVFGGFTYIDNNPPSLAVYYIEAYSSNYNRATTSTNIYYLDDWLTNNNAWPYGYYYFGGAYIKVSNW